MKALQIYAGPKALAHLCQHGVAPQHIGAVAGAAGGPKGLILGPLDRFLFGEWLPQSAQPVHLVGASIGAWRMATACLGDPLPAFERLERDYIAQDYELAEGRTWPSAEQVSTQFAGNLRLFFGGQESALLRHPRFRLHVLASRGLHLLGREGRLRTPLGYAGAFLSNAVHRRALGAWLQRVVFSGPNGPQSGDSGADDVGTGMAPLPFDASDFNTLQLALTPSNFQAALQASCSIPWMLQAVHQIDGAPPGAYWDGGITDYHLHLNYRPTAQAPLVLYPHFQRQVVPGWLDKAWRRRHRATPFLDHMLLLAPRPDWVASLPRGKLPDRQDFRHHLGNLGGRMRDWQAAVGASQQLAHEWARWLQAPDPTQVMPL